MRPAERSRGGARRGRGLGGRAARREGSAGSAAQHRGQRSASAAPPAPLPDLPLRISGASSPLISRPARCVPRSPYPRFRPAPPLPDSAVREPRPRCPCPVQPSSRAPLSPLSAPSTPLPGPALLAAPGAAPGPCPAAGTMRGRPRWAAGEAAVPARVPPSSCPRPLQATR